MNFRSCDYPRSTSHYSDGGRKAVLCLRNRLWCRLSPKWLRTSGRFILPTLTQCCHCRRHRDYNSVPPLQRQRSQIKIQTPTPLLSGLRAQQRRILVRIHPRLPRGISRVSDTNRWWAYSVVVIKIRRTIFPENTIPNTNYHYLNLIGDLNDFIK